MSPIHFSPNHVMTTKEILPKKRRKNLNKGADTVKHRERKKDRNGKMVMWKGKLGNASPSSRFPKWCCMKLMTYPPHPSLQGKESTGPRGRVYSEPTPLLLAHTLHAPSPPSSYRDMQLECPHARIAEETCRWDATSRSYGGENRPQVGRGQGIALPVQNSKESRILNSSMNFQVIGKVYLSS